MEALNHLNNLNTIDNSNLFQSPSYSNNDKHILNSNYNQHTSIHNQHTNYNQQLSFYNQISLSNNSFSNSSFSSPPEPRPLSPALSDYTESVLSSPDLSMSLDLFSSSRYPSNLKAVNQFQDDVLSFLDSDSKLYQSLPKFSAPVQVHYMTSEQLMKSFLDFSDTTDDETNCIQMETVTSLQKDTNTTNIETSIEALLNENSESLECTFCKKTFGRKHDLKRHQRNHLNIKPFKCEGCDKTFSRSDALALHINPFGK
ncbi:hypothetical protein HDU92_000654, partial [Lobulomyces angularis]